MTTAVELTNGKIVHVTDSDLTKFVQHIRGKLRKNDGNDFIIKNERRGYALYWIAHPDHFSEDPKDVSNTAVAEVMDGIDNICEL